MEIKVNDEIINVKDYLPFEDKSEIIQIAYQEAIDSTNFFDEAKFDVLRMLYCVFYYTDIKFTNEEKAEPFKLYDKLYVDGIINMVKDAIPEEEFSILDDYAYTYTRDKQDYDQSFRGIVDKVMAQLPFFLEGLTQSLNENVLPALQKQVEELKSGN